MPARSILRLSAWLPGLVLVAACTSSTSDDDFLPGGSGPARGPADLTPGELSLFPDDTFKNEDVVLQLVVENIGEGFAQVSTTNFIIENEDGDLLYDEDVSTRGIDGGRSETVLSLVIPTPPTYPIAGDLTVTATVDADSEVGDTNTANNSRSYAITITDALAARPDYDAVFVANNPPLPLPDEAVITQFRVRNLGSGPPVAIQVRSRIENPQGLTVASNLETVVLDIGQTSVRNFNWLAPSQAGIYRLVVDVDDSQAIRELRESNNRLDFSFSVGLLIIDAMPGSANEMAVPSPGHRVTR